MSTQRLEAELQRYIGSVVANVRVEFWAVSAETLGHPVGVGITFEQGPGVILSCAGDGGIAIQQGILEPGADNLHLRLLDQLSGSVIESVEFGNNGVAIVTQGDRIQIVNCDDELEISVNDCDVTQLFNRSV